MNAEDVMRAQAEALEMLADQQMRMVRDREVQEALKEVKSPAAKRSLGKLLMWRYTIEDIDALWLPLANLAIEWGCDVVRIGNVEEVQRVVAKQGRLMAQMKAELKDEVEAQTLGASSFMGWNLVKFKEGSGLFGNPMVPIQAKDVRQWEHHFAQRSRDETTARAAMARVREAGVGSRWRGEVQGRREGSGDRRHDRVVASDLPGQGGQR